MTFSENQIYFCKIDLFDELTLKTKEIQQKSGKFYIKAMYCKTQENCEEFVNYFVYNRSLVSSSELSFHFQYKQLDFYSQIDNIIHMPYSSFYGNLGHFDALSDYPYIESSY